MKYVCRKTCQVNIDGKITLVERGDVIDLASPPPAKRFTPLEGEAYEIDFAKASEAELMEAKWTFAKAKAFVKENYDVILKKEEGDKKSDIVARILDARYRAVD